MPNTHPPYAPEFRQRMVELVQLSNPHRFHTDVSGSPQHELERTSAGE